MIRLRLVNRTLESIRLEVYTTDDQTELTALLARYRVRVLVDSAPAEPSPPGFHGHATARRLAREGDTTGQADSRSPVLGHPDGSDLHHRGAIRPAGESDRPGPYAVRCWRDGMIYLTPAEYERQLQSRFACPRCRGAVLFDGPNLVAYLRRTLS